MRIILIVAIASMAIFSCRDGGSSSSASPSQSTSTTNTPSPVQSNQPSSTQGSSSSSEFHYICANNCEGSSANAAGNCQVCGEELVHNTAFHSGGGSSGENTINLNDDDNSFSSKITPLGGEAGSSPAPAQATGDASYHYICSACGGGGNAQGACPNCGEALTHNAAFHNNQGGTATPGASSTQPTTGPKFPSVFNSPGGVQAKPIQSSSGNGFHYICSAGCGGGGNAQGSCPSCGASLTHNAAFHQ